MLGRQPEAAWRSAVCGLHLVSAWSPSTELRGTFSMGDVGHRLDTSNNDQGVIP